MCRRLTACVMTHGHLDIEWYQPMRSFAFWTMEAIDRLIEECGRDADAPTYTLDGQVFPLEEYLAARPENRGALEALIARGKLRIGPFYTQFDEWLPSPEGMVRNCLAGGRAARRYGRPMRVGYLPDNFGHPAQLPQVLNGFGIDTLLFMRGMPWVRRDFPDEFRWTGIDGSSLCAVYFRDGYSRIYGKNVENFAEDFIPQFRTAPYAQDYISYEHYLELTTIDDPDRHAREMIAYVEKIAPCFPSGVVPVMLGCDHSPPHVGLRAAVERANSQQTGIEFIVTEPEAYTERAKAAGRWEEVRCELLGTRFQFLLLGALSARSYIKRQNFAAEALIERYAEPLTACAHRLGARDERELLGEAWKLLMMNHAHDSIHGSSVDAVHDEMTARYHQVLEIGAGLAHRALGNLAARMPHPWREGEQGILFYRPAPNAADQSAEVWLPFGENMRLTDAAGNALPCQFLPREALEENDLGQPSALYYPTEKLSRWLVALPAERSQFSVAVARPGSADAEKPMMTGADFIENGRLRVRADGATIAIEDLRDGRIFRGLNLIEEQAEAGDYWDTSPTWLPSETVLTTRAGASVRVTESGPVRARMEIETAMSVPRCLERGRRSAERVDMAVRFEVSLYRDSDRVDVALTIGNTARDHRLSLIFAPGINGEVLSQNAFAAFERPDADRSHDGECAQPSTRLFPFREWLAIRDGQRGMAIACKGLYDYEPAADPVSGETFCRLTLLRGVGNMGRINMKMRKGVAAWSAPSENAQCLGLQRFEFSYFPFVRGEEKALIGRIEAYLYPPIAHAVRSARQGSDFLCPSSPFGWAEENIRFSAFKAAEDGEGYILRLYEDLGERTDARIQLHGFTQARLCDLNEAPIEELAIEDSAIRVSFDPYRIRTIWLKG